MRPRGGIIGATVQPGASAFNSAAGGIWTLREAEAFKRAGTWPRLLQAPTDLSGLQLWLDASDASTLFDATTGGSLVAADGGVARWEDKSGNGRHATQSNASYRPLKKTSVVNGLAVVRFDGSNDYMRTGAIAALDTITTTQFVVSRHPSVPPSANGVIFRNRYSTVIGGNPALNRQFSGAFLETPNSGRLLWHSRSSAGTLIAPDAASRAQPTANVACVLTGQSDSSGNVTNYFNANAAITSTGSAGTPNGHETTYIGCTNSNDDADFSPIAFLNGDVCELIIYSASLSSAERSAVIAYLMSKWGIS
ncbi:MAG: hypothetical protein EBR82_84780 [Caulobacteraceae bacterium]|nr:hypothetical protein [Caulobacteraceae bacterium]